MNQTIQGAKAIREYLQPETEMEAAFLDNPEFAAGLQWGKPRFGHPEGKVLYHIREVLDNIDKLDISLTDRRKLRIITFVHDTFKYKEHKGHPRDWNRHHSVLARQFLEQYTEAPTLLDITELHDEAFYCWRLAHVHNESRFGLERLRRLTERLGKNVQLYYLFFKCDTCTGDKNLASLYWVEEHLPGITIVEL